MVALDVSHMAIGYEVFCLRPTPGCRSMAFVVIYPIPDYDLHRGSLGRPCGGITPLEAVSQSDRKLPRIAVGLNLVLNLDGDYFFRDIHIADLNRVVDHLQSQASSKLIVHVATFRVSPV